MKFLIHLIVMAGAITLFETMEATYCMPYMMREMKALTAGNPIAELMIMFSFCYLVEGASGFGTPVALGAPMLVSTGHPAFESVVVLLVFNVFATLWGAVGTPIWFGFGNLDLIEEDFLEISRKAAVAVAIASLVVVPWVLTVLIPRKLVRQNILFVFASLALSVGPSLVMALFNYEFPALLGGLIGCALCGVLIKLRVGLRDLADDHPQQLGRDATDIGSVSHHHGVVCKWHRSTSNISDFSGSGPPNGQCDCPGPNGSVQETAQALVERNDENGEETKSATEIEVAPPLPSVTQSLREHVEEHLGPRKSWEEGYLSEVILRTFPIWCVVLLLILTRVEEIGLRRYLTRDEPYFEIYFGTWGTFRCSASLVLQLNNILTYPGLNWSYAVFYVPFVLPFLFVSGLTMMIHRKDLHSTPSQIAGIVAGRLKNPAIALLGAMILVQLMLQGGTVSPASILGIILSDWFEGGFIVVSPLLGALGAFFSGSTTVSNLTFGGIQKIAAESIGTSVTSMLALQGIGAASGNAVCLNNIISACAVVGLTIGEGKIMMQTYKFALVSIVIALVIMLAFFFRF